MHNTTFGYLRTGLIIFGAVLFSMVFHEFGHYVVGSLLGYSMQMDLNSSRAVTCVFLQPWHDPLVLSGGPLATLLQTLAALVVVTYYKKPWLYPLVLVPAMIRIGLYTRFLASPGRLAFQDEAKISNYFGLNPWIVPVVVCLLLLAMVWLGSRRTQAGWKYNTATILTGFTFFVLLLKANQVLFY